MQELKVVQAWMATNWSGVYDQLPKVSTTTLVITGTDDVAMPSADSLIIAKKKQKTLVLVLYRYKTLDMLLCLNISINSINITNISFNR